LLPDRDITTVAAWLSDHAGIEIVPRDRGGGYGEATAKALPHATQVAERAERASDQQLQKVPSARTIARLMTTARHHLSMADTVTIAAIEAGVPMLTEARDLIDRFHAMIRKKIAGDLEPWIAEAKASLIASFAGSPSARRSTSHGRMARRRDKSRRSNW
jgi:transposase